MVAGHLRQHMVEALFERLCGALVLAKRQRGIANEAGAPPLFKGAGNS